MWGVPALPSHDKFRFPIEKQQCLQIDYPNPCYPPVTSNSPTTPFLENPTTCDTDLTARLAIHYYDNSDVVAEAPWAKTTGCDQLGFNPSLTGGADDQRGGHGLRHGCRAQGAPEPKRLRALAVTDPRNRRDPARGNVDQSERRRRQDGLHRHRSGFRHRAARQLPGDLQGRDRGGRQLGACRARSTGRFTWGSRCRATSTASS